MLDVTAAVSSVFDLGKTAIERIWPDPIRRAEELRKLEEMRTTKSLEEVKMYVQLLLGQLSVNVEEAKSKSRFVAGWRPFTGWVCGFALAYQYIIRELLLWLWQVAEMLIALYATMPVGFVFPDPPPALDTAQLMTVLFGMLGLATNRAWEGIKGVKNNTL